MSSLRGWMVALVAVALSVSVAAQRGGGSRSGNRARTPTAYENADLGIKFPAPPEMSLFTLDEPGMYERMLTDGRIAYLANQTRPEETILIKYSDGVSEADLKSYQTTIETSPPQAKLPGFLRIDVAEVPIGTDGAKRAINFVYEIKRPKTGRTPEMDMTLRQLAFTHKSRGFMITCEASKKRFDRVNKDTFDTFLSKIEFQ